MATDVDSAVTFALVAQGQKGVAVVNVDSSFSYTPAPNSNGADSFSDGAITTAALVVSVSITAVNDAPVATAATIVVDEDGVFTGQAAGTDVDDDPLVFALAQATVSDGTATSAAATISVTVTPVDELDRAHDLRVARRPRQRHRRLRRLGPPRTPPRRRQRRLRRHLWPSHLHHAARQGDRAARRLHRARRR